MNCSTFRGLCFVRRIEVVTILTKNSRPIGVTLTDITTCDWTIPLTRHNSWRRFSSSSIPPMKIRLKEENEIPRAIDEILTTESSSKKIIRNRDSSSPEKGLLKQSTPLAAVNSEPTESSLQEDKNSLESLSWKPIPEKFSFVEQVTYYLRLSKARLTTLVVATTAAGFVMGNPTGCAMDSTLLMATLVGTALTSASAASLNQFLEIPFDSQMIRTRNRPLVVAQLTPVKAFTFSAISGVTGLTILGTLVNPLTATLGATNLVLYSFIYTPLKRSNIVNTWIGSFVGAIPPIMGYTAITGAIDPSGLLLGAILYSWQFPHFNALSWNLQHDYARAGYRIMSATDPKLCLRTQLRHSLYLTACCLAMSHPSIGLTTWIFAIDSLPFNLYLIYLSWKFWSNPSSSTSRSLFRYSLIHLPVVILLMIISKISARSPKDRNAEKVASEQ